MSYHPGDSFTQRVYGNRYGVQRPASFVHPAMQAAQYGQAPDPDLVPIAYGQDAGCGCGCAACAQASTPKAAAAFGKAAADAATAVGEGAMKVAMVPVRVVRTVVPAALDTACIPFRVVADWLRE